MNLIQKRPVGFFLTLCILIVCNTGFAQTAAPSEIEFGYPEIPPRTFTNARGEPEGTHFRVAKALFAKAGISWHAVSYPPLRLIKNLQTGPTNFSMLVKNDALVDCCLYSKNPIDFEEIQAYWIGNQPVVKSREDLLGKHLIIVRGYSYGGLINYLKDPQNKITVEVAIDHLSAFDMLRAKRADYVIEYTGPANEALEQRPVLSNLFHQVIVRTDLFLVLSKTYPDAEKVMARLEDDYRSLDKATQLSNYSKIDKKTDLKQ